MILRRKAAHPARPQPDRQKQPKKPEKRASAIFIKIEFIRFHILFPHDCYQARQPLDVQRPRPRLSQRADSISHRHEGEVGSARIHSAQERAEFSTWAPATVACWRWFGSEHPDTEAVAVDFSPAMLEAARKRFAGESSVPSSLTIWTSLCRARQIRRRHLQLRDSSSGARTQAGALRGDLRLLNAGGVFCNLEHVASPTPQLHKEFLERIGFTVETEDPSNKLLDVETQLGWLREIGFVDVDCTGSGGNWRCW